MSNQIIKNGDYIANNVEILTNLLLFHTVMRTIPSQWHIYHWTLLASKNSCKKHM